ncbi:MAG: acyl-CoA dehydrogenase family protein, partial [Deltaproteobacteria bacterium]|nr:acyl-CoA dehydrogenase family protein [Deltaproteobacteria bacterium]
MAKKTVKARPKPPPAVRSDKAAILRQTFRRFTEEEVIPRARQIDEDQALPADLWLELGRMGAFGIRYPKEKGGAGGNTTLYCIICEELARGLVSLAAVYAMQALMGTNFIFRYGTEAQQERYFAPVMAGEIFSAFCLTEPDHSSDLTGCQTTARRDGESFVINGMKTWITNAPKAEVFTVLVQTEPGSGAKGLNFALVDRRTPGLSTSKRFDILGTRSSDLGEVAFSDVVIPAENMLVPAGGGMRALLAILAEIRTMTAALGLGLAKAAYQASARYAAERSQFGRLIKNYQMIQAHVANMGTNIYASELMLADCCARIDRGERALAESSMCKYFVCETACDAADRATRVLGGYAYSM